MRNWLIIISMCFGWVLISSASPPLTNAPAVIELPDQFEQMQKLSFPNTNLTLLTIADRKGSEQIAGWVEPVKKQFGDQINVQGIADVSAVPRLLRGTVRSAFRKKQSYPVMMDWSGETVEKFMPIADQVSIFVISEKGAILRRFDGPVKPEELEEVRTVIETHLSQTPATKPAKLP